MISSGISSAAHPVCASSRSVSTVGQVSSAIPVRDTTASVMLASPAVSAKKSTRRSGSRCAGVIVVISGPSVPVPGDAGQDAAKLAQRLSNGDPFLTEAELAQRPLVTAAAFLDDGNRL